eukprot:c11906_g1_i2.p1 GENE.c11906_g1_i2~~c11906_g1_i2.p1  ORF type:complete len:209 (+),score=41.56 c11906_g1_i2:535-1161(+)
MARAGRSSQITFQTGEPEGTRKVTQQQLIQFNCLKHVVILTQLCVLTLRFFSLMCPLALLDTIQVEYSHHDVVLSPDHMQHSRIATSCLCDTAKHPNLQRGSFTSNLCLLATNAVLFELHSEALANMTLCQCTTVLSSSPTKIPTLSHHLLQFTNDPTVLQIIDMMIVVVNATTSPIAIVIITHALIQHATTPLFIPPRFKPHRNQTR